MVICCAAPGAMITANQKPDEDLRNIKKLIKHLRSVKAEKFYSYIYNSSIYIIK